MEYRRSLAASFLFRFFVDIALKLEKADLSYKAADWLPSGHESAAVHFERPASQGVQYFDKVGEQNIVGQPVRHMAADLQAWPHTQLICQNLGLYMALYGHHAIATGTEPSTNGIVGPQVHFPYCFYAEHL